MYLISLPQGSAFVSSLAEISKSATLEAGAVVGDYAVIGDGAILGEDTCIGHHARIGIGAIIGMNAWIAPYVHIDPNMYIAAGAVVTSDITVAVSGPRMKEGMELVDILRARARGSHKVFDGGIKNFAIGNWRCGTTACVAGHIGLGSESSFASYLGISFADSEGICLPSYYEDEEFTTEYEIASEAADRLEEALYSAQESFGDNESNR